MRVFIASDHGGFALKEFLKERLGREHEIADLGCDSEQSCDYPDFAVLVAKAVAESNVNDPPLKRQALLNAKTTQGYAAAICSHSSPVSKQVHFGCSGVKQAQGAALVAGGSGKALGILCCGTGIGMSLAANKVKGIRAAVVYDEFTAKMAREHNNANIACFGGRNIKPETAAQLAGIFLTAKFAGETKEGERHLKRVQKIGEIEKRYFK